MLNFKITPSTLKHLLLILVALVFLGGCAIGTTEVRVGHDPLKTVSEKRTGKLLVKEFNDIRQSPQFIGNKRNGFGMVLGHIGLHGEKNLELLLTEYFAEALQEAGYEVTIHEKKAPEKFSNAKFDAVIEGEIVEFWMDLYMAVWHRVGVNIKAVKPANQKVLWEGRIEGAEKRVLWVGATGEYERVIREAMTKTLNKAMEEFTSDDFYNAIK